MTTTNDARTALARLDQAGAEQPRVELNYHNLNDEQVTTVLEALDTFPWRVAGHHGTVWLEAKQGGLSINVYMPTDNRPADGPVVAKARELLAKVRG